MCGSLGSSGVRSGSVCDESQLGSRYRTGPNKTLAQFMHLSDEVLQLASRDL